ncbi:unnamed protein product, partial [Urochloa humidicola]
AFFPSPSLRPFAAPSDPSAAPPLPTAVPLLRSIRSSLSHRCTWSTLALAALGLLSPEAGCLPSRGGDGVRGYGAGSAAELMASRLLVSASSSQVAAWGEEAGAASGAEDVPPHTRRFLRVLRAPLALFPPARKDFNFVRAVGRAAPCRCQAVALSKLRKC